VFSLHQLSLIILWIKISRYSYQTINSLRDILYYMSKYELYQLISQRILNQKEFCRSFLKSFVTMHSEKHIVPGRITTGRRSADHLRDIMAGCATFFKLYKTVCRHRCRASPIVHPIAGTPRGVGVSDRQTFRVSAKTTELADFFK